MYGLAYEEQFRPAGSRRKNPWPKLDRLFNWSPKDWRTAPDFNLKDQTESRHAAKIPHIIGQFAADARQPAPVLVARGRLDPSQPLESVYAFESIADRVRRQ
jgi:hypothetical protein